MNTSNWKSTLCAGGLQIIGIPSKIKDMFRHKQTNTAINEVLFYGAEDEEQRKQVGLSNLCCIYYVIVHASYSINICTPSLTSSTITRSLTNVKQKGDNIRIRVAIYNSVDYSSLGTLSKHGIEVKAISSSVQLQHEFILIDESDSADAVAIIGSLDYEVSRVNCNRDTTLITSDRAVISSLMQEFDRVWNSIPDIMKNHDGKAL